MGLLLWYAFLLLIGIALVIGWFLNIVAIVQTVNMMTGMFVGRVLGVFVPFIGGVLGWF
jgi:hypothetical protein